MPLGWWEEEPTHCLCVLPSTHELYVVGEVPTAIRGPREQRHWGMGAGRPSFMLRGCACPPAGYLTWAVLPEVGSEASRLKPSVARAAEFAQLPKARPPRAARRPTGFPSAGSSSLGVLGLTTA